MPRPLFLSERLPHKLSAVGTEALDTAGSVFAELVGISVRDMRLLRIIDASPVSRSLGSRTPPGWNAATSPG